MAFALAFLSMFIEALVGYPRKLAAGIGHPVGWMSVLVAGTEALWNDRKLSPRRRLVRGLLAIAIVLLAVVSSVLLLDHALGLLLPPLAALAIKAALASTLFAGRSLDERVSAVADALENRGLDAGCAALARISDRDVEALDAAGASRTAIETLASGFSEGVVAPLIWLVVGGVPGCAAYKAVNTTAAMVGHAPGRDPAFGWAAERLDDVANLPASRLSVVWLAAAARLMPGADWRGALLGATRDGPRHRTPNVGWPVAAMAGALGLALAGPRSAGAKRIDEAWMGTGRRAATPADVHRALRLYRLAYVLQAITIALLALAVLLVM